MKRNSLVHHSQGIFGHAIELSSKYFTQIHCLFIPLTWLRKYNNAAKFIVSLKQNNSEGFIGAP